MTYKELEEKLCCQGSKGAEWLAPSLGVSPRQVANYRSGATDAPKLVIEKMQWMVENGYIMPSDDEREPETFERNTYDPDRQMREAGHTPHDF